MRHIEKHEANKQQTAGTDILVLHLGEGRAIMLGELCVAVVLPDEMSRVAEAI